MNPVEPATVPCQCCELDVSQKLSSPILNAYGLERGWRCRMCNEHQGNALKKAQDHEYEVRVRWGETVDKLYAAEDRADSYKEKMRAAFRSRDKVVNSLKRPVSPCNRSRLHLRETQLRNPSHC